MKRVMYVVFLLGLWLSLCLPPALAQHAAGPRMVIEERYFDAQQIKEGEIIDHTFTVYNRGDEILEIKKVNPGWGCAVARFDREIPPGGEGRITIRIRTKGYQGDIRKRAYIFTNDPRKRVETVEIRAFVKVAISVSPKYVYFSGLSDQKVTKTVKVRAEAGRPLRLEEDSFSLGNKVTYTIEEVEPGKLYRIHFTSIPGPPGRYKGVLRLKTGYPDKPLLRIPVKANLHAAPKAMKRKGG